MPRYDQDDDDLYTPFNAHRDDAPAEEEGREDDEAEDDLSDLDDDLKARLEGIVKTRTNQYKASVGGRVGGILKELRRAGFDLDEEGLDVRDPQRLTRFLQERMGFNPQAAAAAVQDEAPEEKEDKLPDLPDEIPDVFSDPQGFKAYMALAAKHAVSGSAKDLKDARREISELRDELGDRTFDRVVDVAEECLADYGLEGLLEYPDFAKTLKATFVRLKIDPKQWTDPEMVARVAGVANVDLRKTQPSKRKNNPLADFEDERTERQPPRNRRERRDQEARGGEQRGREERTEREPSPRQVVSRSGRTQIGASGGGERPGTSAFSQEVRTIAERLGMSPAEVQALRQSTPDEYQQLQRRKR